MSEKLKRAIVLGGGGPAAGLHIGVLKRLTETLKFDVWALSCIGAWVGIVYNQCDKGEEVDQTRSFFHDHVFRDDASYKQFPINAVFGLDWLSNNFAMIDFLLNPANYNLLLPYRNYVEALQQTISFLTSPQKWTQGDYNQWMLNNVLAVNPLARFWTSMLFLSDVKGLSRIYYPDSTFLKTINFEKLKAPDKPAIFYNAWNLTNQRLELFYNKPIKGRQYEVTSFESLCACSALPFIEAPVKIDEEIYCEGALIDTVNFKNLLEDHFDLDEIWINRIVDASQIHAPKNLDDALSNLCQLFAATVGEDDIKLFYYHLEEGVKIEGEDRKWAGTIVEIHVNPFVNFEWSHSNLKLGEERGVNAADEAFRKYEAETHCKKNSTGKVRFVNAK